MNTHLHWQPRPNSTHEHSWTLTTYHQTWSIRKRRIKIPISIKLFFFQLLNQKPFCNSTIYYPFCNSTIYYHTIKSLHIHNAIMNTNFFSFLCLIVCFRLVEAEDQQRGKMMKIMLFCLSSVVDYTLKMPYKKHLLLQLQSQRCRCRRIYHRRRCWEASFLSIYFDGCSWRFRRVSRRWSIITPIWLDFQFLLYTFVELLSRSYLPNFWFVQTRWKNTVAEKTESSKSVDPARDWFSDQLHTCVVAEVVAIFCYEMISVPRVLFS